MTIPAPAARVPRNHSISSVGQPLTSTPEVKSCKQAPLAHYAPSRLSSTQSMPPRSELLALALPLDVQSRILLNLIPESISLRDALLTSLFLLQTQPQR